MTTTPKTLLVAINPSASFGRSRSVPPQVLAALRDDGHRLKVLQEPSMVLLERSCREALVERPDALLVIGGDGMVHLGVNLLADGDIPLAVVPSGTGNDFARGIGIPLGGADAAIQALRLALAAPARRIDLMRIEHAGGIHWAAGVLSAGFDAIVNERANLMRRPRGAQRYTIAMVRELLVLTPRRYELVVDGPAHSGERRSLEAVLISVANNAYFGGGMKVAPEASLDDGLLDLFIVEPLSRTGFLRVFPKVFKGEHADHPKVRLERVRSVRLEAPGLVGYADGERVGALPLMVAVAPGALPLLAPPDGVIRASRG